MKIRTKRALNLLACGVLGVSTACASHPKSASRSASKPTSSAISDASSSLDEQHTSHESSPSSSNSGASTSASQTNSEAGPGLVLIEQDFALDVHQLPLVFMADAREEMAKKNFGNAAASLKAAGKVLDSETKEFTNADQKSDVAKAAHILSSLSQQVQNQQIHAVDKLDQQLAEIAFLRASAHQAKAQSEWASNEYKRAGHDLHIATNAFLRGSAWAGQELAQSGVDMVNRAQRVSASLMNGTGWVADDVKSALKSVDTMIQQLHEVAVNHPSAGTSSSMTSGSKSQAK